MPSLVDIVQGNPITWPQQSNPVVYDNGNSGASKTISWNNGNTQKVTLTADCTFTFSNPVTGATYTLELIQDGTGSRLATWPAAVAWPNAIPPVLETTAAAIDIVQFWYDGTNYQGTYVDKGFLQYDNGNSGASKTINWRNGDFQKITLTANCTLTLSNPIAGKLYILQIIQDGTGSRTITWPGTLLNTPTLQTAASSIDLVLLFFDGTNYQSFTLGAGQLDKLTVRGDTTLSGILNCTLRATFTAGAQSSAVARTATADGLTTGVIASGTRAVDVTSANAAHLMSLPSPVSQNIISLTVGANGYRLQTNDPATVGINGVAPGGGTYMQVPANSHCIAICTSATTWIVFCLNTVGALTSSVAAVNGQSVSPRLMHGGGLPARVSTDGTDATPVNTEVYITEVFVPANTSITGVALFNGSAVAGDVKVGLCDSTGAVVATSASTAQSGTDAYQRIPFTSAYSAKGPATYYIVVIFDTNTTPRYNAFPFGNFGAAKQTGQVFATGFTTITPPTTFTADLAAIASLY